VSTMDRDSPLARLTAHTADCAECEKTPLPLERIAAVLEATVPAIDAAALSRQTFVQLRSELQRQSLAVGWRRIAIGVLLSLLPLPLVLAYNAYLLHAVYDLLSSLLPAAVAAYLVLSYAAFLLLLFATTYAAIPLLMAHRPVGSRSAPA